MQSKWVKKKVVGPFGWLALTAIFIFFITVSIVIAGNVWYQKSLEAPGTGVEKMFVIKKGEAAEDVALRLEADGIISNSFAFRIYLYSKKIDEEIEAGSFKLSSDKTAQEIAEDLQHGQLDKWVTLVEGLRVEEIAEKIAEEIPINKKEFISLAEEGYMFPDTYLIPTSASEKRIVSIIRENFNEKVNNKVKNEAKKNGLSTKQLIILASIVEREAKGDEERPMIAGILIKRFNEGIPLAVDATIQYVLGYQEDDKSWWKKELTIQDLELDSPFNTRKVAGLPPSPISNPGLASIKAVAEPTKSLYYYYLHGKDGKVRFAKTLEEHNENIAKYLN